MRATQIFSTKNMTFSMIGFKYVLIPPIGLFVIILSIFLYWAGLSRGLEDGVQGVITFYLILISAFLPIICCVNRKEEGDNNNYDFFQPGVIVAIFYYLYILIPGVHIWYNLNYISNWIQVSNERALVNYTFLVGILGIIFFGLGYRSKIASFIIPMRLKKLSHKFRRIKWPNDAFIKKIIVILISIGFVSRLYLLTKIGGVSSYTFQFLSPSMRAELGLRIPGILVLASSFFDWGALFLLLRYIVTQKQKYITVLIVLVAIVSTYLLGGKRSDVFPFFFFPLVWYHYLRNRISFNKGLIYLFCGFILMTSLLFIRIIGPLVARSRSGDIDAVSEIVAKPMDFYLNSPELAVFDMTMVSIRERTHILESIGGWLNGILNYNLSTILYLVPRSLWHDKPIFRDLGQELFRLFISDTGSAGFSVGIFAGLYVFGGLLGVLLGMAVIGIFFRSLYVIVQPWRGDPSFVFIYSIAIWIFFQFLRFGTLGFTILFFIQKLILGTGVGLLWLYIRGQTNIFHRKNNGKQQYCNSRDIA